MAVDFESHSGTVTLTLNDPARRNALSRDMFDALERSIARLESETHARIAIVRGHGPAFCAGFDLAACVEDDQLLPEFILRLSRINRALRRLPQVVVAAVHGAAIAGGCAMLSACDFVIAAPDAVLGYPVHPIGISPAVTIPMLRLSIGDGAARQWLLSGEIIDGREAFRRGLVSNLATSSHRVHHEAAEFASALLRCGAHAQRTTKAWLNELDGSLEDSAFDSTAGDSAQAATFSEARQMLQRFWEARKA